MFRMPEPSFSLKNSLSEQNLCIQSLQKEKHISETSIFLAIKGNIILGITLSIKEKNSMK